MARAIDADEFMKNFDKEIENGATDVFDAVENALEETPTIEAEPVKHGKWGETYYHYGEGDFVRDCSECGEPYSPQTRYCPNCGARMDGEANETKTS